MPPDAREQFLQELRHAVERQTLLKLTLSKPRQADPALENVFVRPTTLRGAPHLTFLWRYRTRDITKNHAPSAAIAEIETLVGQTFFGAHLFTPERTLQLDYNKKGESRLVTGQPAPVETSSAHDRTKNRLLSPTSQLWLQALGVTNSAGQVREGLADKHRQIHKFVELLSHLVAQADLPTDRVLEIADMGCGKGYLTFATHDYFNDVLARPANVLGLEARPELVELCQRIARESGRGRLKFAAGTIQEAALPSPDVLIALHACDTATDDALARGVSAGTSLIVVSPCCQKELRPQLHAAPVLAPALRHGIFQERQAEFVTDALRALLLEWAGYDTKVFEFISTEHTAKNLMIAATRRREGQKHPGKSAEAVRALAAFYGIRQHALAAHLGFALAPDA